MPGKIFVGQSALRVVIKTYADLTDAASVLICYRKPDRTRGAWQAGVLDRQNGDIVRECAEGDFDQSGWWRLWARVAYNDGRVAIGAASKIYVWNEGQ
jgi:hypothetical protein